LNMYYSKVRILIFSKIATMSIWIIFKNIVWTWKVYFLLFLSHYTVHFTQ
jgi:hypothetical protein